MSFLSGAFNSIQKWLIPSLEDEIGVMGEKEREFVLAVELVNPAKYMPRYSNFGCMGRLRKNRLAIFKAFLAKSIFAFADTKSLLVALRSNPSLRRLCGWETVGEIPHASTFSRAFAEFAEDNLLTTALADAARRGLDGKLVGHVSRDGTMIEAREKAAPGKPKPKPKPKAKSKEKTKGKSVGKRRVGKSGKSTKARGTTPPPAPKRLALQAGRSLDENLADLPKKCDWGSKTNSQGKPIQWKGYKLHVDTTDGGIPVSAVLTSASVHDSQAAIPLAQMTSNVVVNCYDLMDAAYDAKEIHDFSKGLGHVPIIDHNPRRGEKRHFDPATKTRYNERSTAERLNSELKDNYGGRNIRVRGNAKVFTHLAFGLLAICAKQVYNMLM
jgi:hypothetical protein